MSQRDFLTAIREADRQIARQGVAAATDRRIRERLASAQPAPSHTTRRWVAIAVGLAAVAGAVALGIVGLFSHRSAELGGFTLASGPSSARVTVDGAVEALAGGCLLEERSMQVRLRPYAGGKVRKERGGVRVVRGRVEVEVAPRTGSEAPALIFVSAGVIEVMGTRFVVVQGEGGGTVSLVDGRVRFVDTRETVTELSPGQTLSFADSAELGEPAPPEAATETRPDRVQKKTHADQAAGVRAILDRVQALRSRHLYQESVDELERALAADLAPATRERLSFERGSILTRQLTDRARACAHWAQHARRFPAGRYANEVKAAIRELGCTP